MLITFSTIEAVRNEYQNDLMICGLLTFAFFVGSFFVKCEWTQIGWKLRLTLTGLFLGFGLYVVRTSTIDNFVNAKVEADSVSLKFATRDAPVVLNRDQLLDVSVGYAGKHHQSCYLIVVPKEGWYYSSAIISNECTDCEKYRDRARAILKLNMH